MEQDRSDPLIDEIQEIRRRICARFDNDPHRLVAHYMEIERRRREGEPERAEDGTARDREGQAGAIAGS